MKKILTLCGIFFLSFLLIPTVYCENTYSDDFRNSVDLKDSLLSEDTDLNDPEGIMKDIKTENIFSYLFQQIKNAFGEVLKTLVQGIALVLLSVILNRCSGNIQNQNLQMLFSFIVSLAIALMCEGGLRSCASALQKAVEDMRVLTTACIPSFSVVMIAAGEGMGASVFSASMVLLGELGTVLSDHLLMPLTDVFLAIGICSAVSDEYNFASISKNIRRFVIWSIGILMVIFRLIMKLQTGAASAGDRLTQKYIRSAVGGLIPMVGNTLSQGVDGLFAAAAGVKTTFAIAGVLIVLSITLPVLIQIGVHGLIWSLCKWVADFMNDTTVRSVADVLANSFYMMLALGGCVTLMGLFSFFGLITQVA